MELAELAGTSQTAISAYESGARTPSLDTLTRLLRSSGARLAVLEGTEPARTPSARELAERARILLDVLDLAEALPFRRAYALSYPRLDDPPPGRRG